LKTLSVQPLSLATKTEFKVNLLRKTIVEEKAPEKKEQKKGLKLQSKFDKKKVEVAGLAKNATPGLELEIAQLAKALGRTE
jgi:hypothetical protein